MLGAIIGDVCGSVYEFNNDKRVEKIQLFRDRVFPTDDSVMTVAVAKALVDSRGRSDRAKKDLLIDSMHYYGRLFPHAGYGETFKTWLKDYHRNPYNSWGNGSGMRVAAVGWLYDTLEKTLHVAKLTAEVTHNHPEGIKGAQAIAAAIFMARTGKSKEEIRDYVEQNFYKLDFTLDEIRPYYGFDVSCQGSCPQAIEAFLEGENFEDVIRKAISIGGDSDTIAAMAGAIAEAFYGIPKEMADQAFAVMVDKRIKGTTYNDQVLADEVKRFWEYLERNGMKSPRPEGY